MSTNEKSTTGCPMLRRVRFPTLSAITLLGLFVILSPASATSPEWATALNDKIKASEDNISAHGKDLNQISHSLHGVDFQILSSISDSALQALCKLHNIRELVMIEPLVHDKDDKALIEALINGDIDSLAEHVDAAVQFINKSMPDLRNQAAILAASKLRDDLRESKDLPKPVP